MGNSLLASPRLRFWLVCATCLFLAPACVFGLVALAAPPWAFVAVALACWLGPVAWVLAAHRALMGRLSITRAVLVFVGLSIAMYVLSTAGILMATIAFTEVRMQ